MDRLRNISLHQYFCASLSVPFIMAVSINILTSSFRYFSYFSMGRSYNISLYHPCPAIVFISFIIFATLHILIPLICLLFPLHQNFINTSLRLLFPCFHLPLYLSDTTSFHHFPATAASIRSSSHLRSSLLPFYFYFMFLSSFPSLIISILPPSPLPL